MAGTYGGKDNVQQVYAVHLIAMALGIVMGALIFNYLPDIRADIAADVNLIAMLFLRLIKMIIAPLVFATLVGGIAHMGSGAKLGRISPRPWAGSSAPRSSRCCSAW
jgi:Na+/H+-dicarboxylate symporter